MTHASIPRSPARFVVPISIIGCTAVAFALYAWGGIGPAEQRVIAQANAIRFGAYAPALLPAVEPMVVLGKRDGAPPRAAARS
jgi:hypothetical protein